MKRYLIFLLIFISACMPTSTELSPLASPTISSLQPRLTITTDGYELDCAGRISYQGIAVYADDVTVTNCLVIDNNLNSGGILVEGHNNIIKNNRIDNSCMAGIIVRGNSNLIEGNEISRSRQCPGTSGPDADGIRVFQDGNKIIGNYVHSISLAENPTAHIDCIQSFGNLTNTLIQGNFCDTAHAGMQTDSGYNVQGITITENKFIASRPLNVYGDGITVTNNVFIGRVVSNITGASVSFRDSKNITFTHNVILNTTDGVLTRVGVVVLGGNNVFWNDSGIAPRRDSGYSGSPSNLNWKSDKWQTVNPMLNENYFTGNPLVCYAGLGCVPATVTPTLTVTPTPSRTPTRTITPTRTATMIPTVCVQDFGVCLVPMTPTP